MRKIVLLFLFIILLVIGCSSKNNFPVVQDLSFDSHSFIPFLIKNDNDDNQQHNIYIGAWDFEKGTLRFQNKNIIDGKGKEFTIFWNGNNEMDIMPIKGDDFSINYIKPGFIINKVKYDDFILKKTFDGENVKICNNFNVNSKYSLIIEKKEKVIKIPIKPDFSMPYETVRPVDLSIDDKKIVLYVELCYVNNINISNDYHYALIKGEYINEHEGIIWDTIASDLEFNEAGSGVNIVKYGNLMVIADQDNYIKTLNLSDGTITDVTIINNRIKDFISAYVNTTEYSKPPMLFIFNELLIIKVQPVVTTPQQTFCFIVYNKDKILGEIIAQGKEITVLKEGKPPERCLVEDKYMPYMWIFPQ